jgi:malate dehydrogenase (oxaloacetate-decarboxylating)(NADP+)
VAVISNGTAILGLGDLGALASKPVMEGKSVLFKRFGDVDSIDIEISSKDADEIITVVKNIGVTFGGINLEDIKSPECFRIETELQELLDIPVFHDDQHGTAIICAAGLINACHITGKRIEDVKVVLNGPGAAGIASLELIKAMGVKPDNVIAVDSKGVLYQGRTEGMNQWKSAHAVDTPLRTLAEAVVGADVLLGLSAKGAFTPEMIASHGPQPGHLRHGQSRSRRSPRRRSTRSARTRSWAPAAATIPTRSTTSWASPTSSAAPWTCGPGGSITR